MLLLLLFLAAAPVTLLLPDGRPSPLLTEGPLSLLLVGGPRLVVLAEKGAGWLPGGAGEGAGDEACERWGKGMEVGLGSDGLGLPSPVRPAARAHVRDKPVPVPSFPLTACILLHSW